MTIKDRRADLERLIREQAERAAETEKLLRQNRRELVEIDRELRRLKDGEETDADTLRGL